MHIRAIHTHLLQVPFPEPPKTGFLSLEHMDLLVVEVETDTGVIGTGHLHPLAGGLRTLESCIQEMFKPLLLDEVLDDVPRLWQKMWRASFIQGRMGITVMAMSALDMALWDALGRAQKVPLWQLWGGQPEPQPIYGSGCFRGLGHDGMIERAKQFADLGFTAIKMQVAHVFSNDEDVANVRDMRSELGNDMHIMIDVNQGWQVDEAIAVGRRLDEYGPYWLEEPVWADDFDGYHRIADAIQTPIAGGENLFTHKDFAAFLHTRKIPFLQPDIMRGGYSELLLIAKLANEAGLNMAWHLFPEFSVHMSAAIPNAAWLEYMGWSDELWIEPNLPQQGFLIPPDRPGHGMDFKPELFRDFALD